MFRVASAYRSTSTRASGTRSFVQFAHVEHGGLCALLLTLCSRGCLWSEMHVQGFTEREQGTTTSNALGCDVVGRFAYGSASTQASATLQLEICQFE